MKWILPTLILIFVSGPALAQDNNELFLELRMGNHIAEDTSVDVVSDFNAIPMLQLGVGAALPQLPELRLGLAYLVKAEGIQPARFGGALDLEWGWQKVMATADWGPTLFGFLRPSAKIGLGYAVQYLGLESNGALYEDYAHDFAYSAALNVEASFLVHQSDTTTLRLAANTEFGYQGQTAATFDELEREETDEWDRQPPVLGDLNTDGLMWSIGVGLIIGF